jgi:hypothetical protein
MEVDTTSCDTVAISRNNASVAFGGGDGSVRLFEVASGAERARFTGARNAIGAVAVGPDGRTLAASSADAPVYIWDMLAVADQPKLAPTAAELDRAWSALANSDAKVAYQSICRLTAAPDATLALLRTQLKPAVPADAAKVREWIRQLNESQFERRMAEHELERFSDQVEEELLAALKSTQFHEAQVAIRRLLHGVEAPTVERLRAIRAIEILECIATPAARELLKALAAGAPGAHLTEAAAAASKRLER